jgi:hypothetical protein
MPPQRFLRPPLHSPSSVVRTVASGAARAGTPTKIAEMRCAERIPSRPRLQRLRQRFRALLRRDHAAGLHPLQHVGLPFFAASGCRSGRSRDGDCGTPASSAASARLNSAAPLPK